MISILGLAGAASAQGRRRVMSGGVPPANITPPVLAGTVGIGLSLTVTPGTWSGSPSLTYTLLRDGVAVGGLTGVSEATIEAYALVAADIGPELDLLEEDSVSATDAITASPLVWDDNARAPNTAIWVSDEGRTDVSGAADSWASTYGGKSATLTAAGAGNRPAVSSGGVGGRALLTFDGTDDCLKGSITLGAAHVANEYAITGRRVAFGTLGDVWIGYNLSGLRYGMRDRTASTLYNGAGSSSIIAAGGAPGDPDANNQRWWCTREQATTSAAIGHSTVTDQSSSGATVNSQADSGVVSIGGDEPAAVCVNVEIQGADFGQLMTSTERTEVRAFLTYKTGIAA